MARRFAEGPKTFERLQLLASSIGDRTAVELGTFSTIDAAFRAMAGTCANLSDFVRACHFAAVKHRSQRRKDAEATPYINHPIGSYIEYTN